jgi:hypothetical protein
MNQPIWPPLLDGTYLACAAAFAGAVVLFSSLTTEHQSRSILGRALERYRAIPEDELAPALEDAGKTRFYSVPGIVAVLLCAMAWRLILHYGVLVTRFGKAHAWPTWTSFLLAVVPALVMPFLMQWSSRWLMRRRLDRRFANRLAT